MGFCLEKLFEFSLKSLSFCQCTLAQRFWNFHAKRKFPQPVKGFSHWKQITLLERKLWNQEQIPLLWSFLTLRKSNTVQTEKLEGHPLSSTGGEAGRPPPIKYRRKSWKATPYQVQAEKLEGNPYQVQAEKLEGHPLSGTGGEAGRPPPIRYRRRSCWKATPYQVQAEKLEGHPTPPVADRGWHTPERIL